MTKTIKFFSLLAALALAPSLWAAGPIVLRWLRDVPHDETGTTVYSSVPCQYADGTPLRPGSVAYLLFVVPNPGTTFASDEVPFSIGVDGTVTRGAGVARVAWARLNNAGSEIYGIQLDDGDLRGYPATEWTTFVLKGSVVGGTTASASYYWPSDAGTMPARCYAYLVVFDLRAMDPATGALVSVDVASNRALPRRVVGWGATQCAVVEGTSGGGVGPGGTTQPLDVYVCLPETLSGILAQLDCNVAGPVRTTEIPTLTEWMEEGEATLAGADLEAAVTPAISGMVVATMGEGEIQTPAFGLTLSPAELPDLMTYTLYTATDLAGPWKPFDQVLAGLEEKPLALGDGLRYTALRLNGEGSVSMTIPRLAGDSMRFYRLQGDVEVSGANQEGE